MKILYSARALEMASYQGIDKKNLHALRLLTPVSEELQSLIESDGIALIVQNNFNEFLDLSYDQAQKLVRTFFTKFPELSALFGSDLHSVVVKHLLWSRLQKESLRSELVNYPSHEYKYVSELDTFAHRAKARVKLLLKAKKRKYIAKTNDLDKRIAGKLIVRISRGFQVTLIEKMLSGLPKDSYVFMSFYEENDLPEKFQHVPVLRYPDFENRYNFVSPSKLVKLAFSTAPDEAEDLVEATNVANYYGQIYAEVCKAGPKGFFFLAGENESSSLMAAKVAKLYGVPTYNYMNGIKGKTTSNLDTEFSTWFMHDQFTKEVLLKYDEGLSDEGCPVVGHLEADNFREMMEDESLVNPYFKTGQRTITVFSSPIYYHEKKDLTHFLNELAEDPDTVIYYKLHPSQRKPDVNLSDKVVIIDLSDKMLNRQLILASNLVITFASTVALEANMVNEHVWNIEYREKSIVPIFNDHSGVVHIKTKEELAQYCAQLREYPRKLKSFEGERVSEKLISYIL